MPGRKFTQLNSKYRYGFNGKEKDNSTGEGNLDFGARVYDGRLGRWLAVDRDASDYPSISVYTFSINSPLRFNDPNGNWVVEIIKTVNGKKETYSLSFKAEKDDNLETLATQLGLPKEALLKSDASLGTLKIEDGVSVALSTLDIVVSINNTLSKAKENDNAWNCASFACNPTFKNLPDQYGDYVRGSNLEQMDGILNRKYESVEEMSAQIGSIVRYEFDQSMIDQYMKGYSELKSRTMKEKGSTPEEIESYLKSEQYTKDFDDTKKSLKDERHYALVLLKDKTGTKILNVIQKYGSENQSFIVFNESDPTSNGSVLAYYNRGGVKKGSNPIYTKKEKNKKEKKMKRRMNKLLLIFLHFTFFWKSGKVLAQEAKNNLQLTFIIEEQKNNKLLNNFIGKNKLNKSDTFLLIIRERIMLIKQKDSFGNPKTIAFYDLNESNKRSIVVKSSFGVPDNTIPPVSLSGLKPFNTIYRLSNFEKLDTGSVVTLTIKAKDKIKKNFLYLAKISKKRN